ncbi:hypothetical protein fHeYen901_222 [Yersinia phage fHe-Yen9-01]|uniref:Uncharacterized protein n=1 Tax=Yersinia phage fHe-Yen9-01 TaxID=1965363 RepID=A0A1V0DXX6_9CAUD|nr:hypothetical protein KNT60_gp221 [Yersinia phage fHe-Yen9-01]ARB05995.1 hypothetical protein fHeYen901_222 [Yersinia phage fHe-Yen9-01]
MVVKIVGMPNRLVNDVLKGDLEAFNVCAFISNSNTLWSSVELHGDEANVNSVISLAKKRETK